jgi:hypothetical protein
MAFRLSLWSLLGIDGSFLTHGSENDDVCVEQVSKLFGFEHDR